MSEKPLSTEEQLAQALKDLTAVRAVNDDLRRQVKELSYRLNHGEQLLDCPAELEADVQRRQGAGLARNDAIAAARAQHAQDHGTPTK